MKRRLPTIVAILLAATTALAAEYTISTLEELREFMEAVHVEDFAGDTITLTADIDCEGGRFNTGDPEDPSTFRGTFDGGGHVISNFVHQATGGGDYGFGVAMFDFAETGATIQNLTLEGSLPETARGAYAAPFVLAVESPLGLFMDNCHFRGGVTNYYHAAGLVGFARSGMGADEVPSVVLTNCSVRGEIVSTWGYAAGGLVAKGTGVQAYDCSVEGEIRGGRTGGLVGEAYGGSFEGCSFEGTMRPDCETDENCFLGGLVGQASNAVFRACTSVVGLGSMADSAGGAAGMTFGSAAFYDCSASVEAAVPYDRFGGFVGWTAGAETFSNCTANLTVAPIPVVNPAAGTTNIYSLTTGGFAASVSSYGALFVDCTVEGKLAGGTRACGFVGSATLNGGEIARCAVFVDVSTLTNRTDGMAAGFAGSLSLSGGATVRECFSAGSVDAAGEAAGFAYEIDLRDDQSQVRDCYSTAEVLAGVNRNPAGFACRISDNNDAGGVLPVANCWFGGTVRVRGTASDYYKPYGFAYDLTGDVSFENCAWIEAPGANEAGTVGVTALPQAASRKAASWPGYDFTNVWSMAEDSTTPYFAWSLANGNFRLFAMQEPGKTITIPEYAAPGSTNAVSAVAADDLFFCGWAGGAFYTNAVVTPSALLADNHRTARCVWGTAISTAEELLAVTNDLAGIYVLTQDIDLGGAKIPPIGDDTTAFSGEFYGRNHSLSNFVVESTAKYIGLFGRISGGHVSGVVAKGTVSGAAPSGTAWQSTGTGGFAGAILANSLVEDCSFEGVVTNATAYNTGGFVGYVAGTPGIRRCFFAGTVAHLGSKDDAGGFVGCPNGGSIADCYAVADVEAGARGYVGGFAGYMGNSAAIATSWCAGRVETTGSNYKGAFAGYASSGKITKSYYDSDKTSLLAVNKAAYSGVTPLTSAQMLHEANFPDFDFLDTWKIDEGETTPYLLAFLVQKTGYEQWLEDKGLPADTAPEAEADGVPYLIRYVFDRPTGAFSPFKGISFNDDGDVVISMLTIKKDEGVTVKVLASTSLTDWSHAVETEITVQSDGTLVFPRTADPARFFKLSVSED